MAEKENQTTENSDKIKHPHDHFVKTALSRIENAKSFLENYLPEEIRSLLEIATLEIEKDSFVTQDLQDYYSDLLYKVKFSGHDGYIYLLFEHKSYNEKWIALQLLEYILQIWKLKKSQAQKLPIVIPLVLHHGKTKWTIGLKLSDLLEHKEDKVLPYIPDFQYILHDLTTCNDESIKGIEKLKVMLYLLKYVSSPELMERLGEILRLLKDIPDSEMDYLVSITVYILHATEIPFPKFAEIVEKSISRKGCDIAMTTAEQLIEKGKIEGIREGKIEGIREGKIEGIREGKIEGIEIALDAKFGEKSLYLMKQIREITDIDKLTPVQKAIKQAKNIQDFEKILKKNDLL